MKQIKINCKGSGVISIEKLKNFQGNLKELKEKEYLKLKNSILKYGFAFPVIVWKNNIIDGHQRVFAIKKMIKEGFVIDNIPVAEIEAKDEKEAKKKLLIFNSKYGKITDEGLYEFLETSKLDLSELSEELELPNIDLDNFADNFYNILETEGDDNIPDTIEAITKIGDLYEIGKHRLLCGDSTKKEDVKRLMNGDKTDMVFTDPPYELKNMDFLNNLEGNKKFIFGADKQQILYCNLLNGFRHFFIQRKNPPTLVSNNSPMSGHNLISFFCNSKIKVNFKNTKDFFSTFLDKDCDKSHSASKNRTGSKYGKQVSIPEKFIIHYSNKNDKIQDLFLGGGSTLIACEKTNRICYGMELDQHFCDIIIERYKQYCKNNNIKTDIKKNGKQIWEND